MLASLDPIPLIYFVVQRNDEGRPVPESLREAARRVVRRAESFLSDEGDEREPSPAWSVLAVVRSLHALTDTLGEVEQLQDLSPDLVLKLRDTLEAAALEDNWRDPEIIDALYDLLYAVALLPEEAP